MAIKQPISSYYPKAKWQSAIFERMKFMPKFLAYCLLIGLFLVEKKPVFAQENVMTFGFQIKPILPFSNIRANSINFENNDVNFQITNRLGYSAGMIIRSGMTKNFSIESGINFIARNKTLTVSDNLLNISATSDFRLVGYEIPVLLLAFVQLSDEVFMNGALGLSLNFFPSDVGSTTQYYFHRTTTKSWIWPGLMANIGWDYRTLESGIFYFGASWHSFFTDPFRSSVGYERPGERVVAGVDMSGTYLTLDFRYFFHEEAKKRKKKKSNEVDILWYRNQKK